MANEAPGKKKAAAKVKRPTALKRDLQNEKRRLRNRSFSATVKTAVRDFDETVSKGDAATTKTSLNLVYSLMDKGVKRGLIKLNTANRTKSRLTKRLTTPA
ncbi:MAG: 30S ribosomal protein S20 [Parachlamydiaceae bacterium]|nr:30S ribosomal protein S20 [Parachlamydiaceae bacterium]